MPEIAGQRLGSASATHGNVAGSHTPGNITPETRLPGCPERIRTLESRDARPAPGAPPCHWNRSEIRTQGSTPPGPASRGFTGPPVTRFDRLARSTCNLLTRWRRSLARTMPKKPYQWFTLLICVAHSAYFSKAAQNSAAASNSRSSASWTGRGRCGGGA